MVSVNPTGVGNYITALLQPLCEAHPGTEFFLYSNSRVAFAEFANVTIREGGASIGPIWMNTQLPLALRKDRVDVFWGANGISPVVGWAPPSVVTVHDLVYRFAGHTMGRGARWTKWLFQGWCVRQARQVIAVSKATANDVSEVYGRQVDAVIPPLAHPSFRRPGAESVLRVATRLGLPDRYWLCAGTLEPRKNLVGLLTAYMVSLEEGCDLPLLALAGNPGWDSGQLNALIARGEASGHVRRLGYVPLDDLVCLYAGCELLWMPSFYEGFGMPLLEAQRCGAAVVHGSHPSMAEAADGLGLSTETDVQSLHQTLRSLARNEAPLTCRLAQADPNEIADASSRLWQQFCAAMVPQRVQDAS